jgi:hypothetical protein
LAHRTATCHWLLLVLAATACQGPGLTVATDGACFVDGHRETRSELPFRYYGTTTIDVLPEAATNGQDFQRTPNRQDVQIEPPCPPWLFPFDLLGEVAVRAFSGIPQQAAKVTTKPAENGVVEGPPPSGLDDLRARAQDAKISR